MELKFTIDGTPIGKQRPKVTVRGGYAHAYTPQKTSNYEKKIRDTYLSMCKDQKLQGAILAQIKCYFLPPKSITKKEYGRIVEGVDLYTKMPDCDNVAKSVLDALNGTAYDDDKQVVKLIVEKHYGDVERVDVFLKEIENDKEM